MKNEKSLPRWRHILHGLRENSSLDNSSHGWTVLKSCKADVTKLRSNNKAREEWEAARTDCGRAASEWKEMMQRERRKTVIRIRRGIKERGIKAGGHPDKYESCLITRAELRSDAEVSAFEAAEAAMGIRFRTEGGQGRERGRGVWRWRWREREGGGGRLRVTWWISWISEDGEDGGREEPRRTSSRRLLAVMSRFSLIQRIWISSLISTH